MKFQTFYFYFLLISFFIVSCTNETTTDSESFAKIRTIDASTALDLAKSIRSEVAVKIDDDFELSLWASDSLIHDPIAISIDDEGKIYYTSATRQSNSEFDIRGHRNWMTASISFETPEDRRAFLRETFTEGSEESEKHLKDLNKDGVLDWRDLTVEKEEVWWVADEDKDGVAEKAQLFIKDFHEEITDVANGVLVYDKNVYLAVAPDLWKINDKDGDGFADSSESLSHGYAVHIGFSGHGMSGVTVGPDGRIWWGIGDIGMNVTDKEGKKWEYPNEGVIVRSDPDGSNFEVYAAGVRNTHEFVFDKYGNLISEDNDGDHRGERERLVYIINGSDSGWRSNWQYGKYTDPDNNEYKVWMDEKMSVPRWDGQAAYIVPPIQNYVNGPTGMVYNPGTALGKKWYDHFFIAEFRGNPANSPIHAFTLETDGAGFKLGETKEVVSGLLPTGIDIGPDGALYFGDWIDGWGTKDKGRIWKLDVPGGSSEQIRVETKQLIAEDFSTKTEDDLSVLLGHQDMRVRMKAQFELVKRGEKNVEVFGKKIDSDENQLARIHSIWGLAQLARKNSAIAEKLTNYLDDKDLEIQAQVIKMLGDVKYKAAGDKVIPKLKSESLRIRMLAAEALGRMEHANAKEGLIALLVENNDKDVYIRHAASLALAKIGDADILVAQKDHASKALRLGAVVALRRMHNEGVKAFLNDKDEMVVTEAARAINDDTSIPGALPDLANILNTTKFKNEALIRRSINANFRIGENGNVDQLIAYISNPNAPAVMRSEAIACISTWAKPSVLDRVDGRNRNLKPRDATYAKEQISKQIVVLSKSSSDQLLIAVAKALNKLQLNDKTGELEKLFTDSKSSEFRREALISLSGLKSAKIDKLLESALASDDSELRATALTLIPESSLEESKAVTLFDKILNNGSIIEKQSAFSALSNYKGSEAIQLLSNNLKKLISKDIEPELQLDLIEASTNNGNESLVALIDTYNAQKDTQNPLSEYLECLSGGNSDMGRNIFYRNEAAQCVRCHAIYEWGGDAGPGLHGVAKRLEKTDLLEALILPSARLAEGFGVLSVEMKDGTEIVGVVEKDSEKEFVLRVSKDETKTVNKGLIVKQSFLPSSMPSVVGKLSKKEIRDVISFLSTLTNEGEPG